MTLSKTEIEKLYTKGEVLKTVFRAKETKRRKVAARSLTALGRPWPGQGSGGAVPVHPWTL